MQAKQARYDELCAKDDAGQALSQLEMNESTQLFYELDESRQYWRDEHPDLTPEDTWHAKRDGSKVAG